MNKFSLPPLPYDYSALEPVISKTVMTLHHDKHHAGYVTGANAALEKLESARTSNAPLDYKSILKELSFHVGGHTLHNLFWTNMTPISNFKEPEGKLAEKIKLDFGNLNQLKKEFSAASLSVEGSGWGALTYSKELDKLIIMQIEKHNLNLYPTFDLLLVLDVWEHSYYLDYQNNRGKFVEEFWKIVDWKEINSRFTKTQ
jgi:superoxide dismutase, Fe-Mn family